MSNTKDTNTVSVTGKFDVKTLLAIFGVLIGIGGAGWGTVEGIMKPTTEAVTTVSEELVSEVRLLRMAVDGLIYVKYEVEKNSAVIDSVAERQTVLSENQIKGFGALWEQNKLVLRRLNEIEKGVHRIDSTALPVYLYPR